MSTHIVSSARRRGPSRQRGVVLLFSLIALGIMLIVAVALVRSFNSSLFTAGNIGFKRDLQNQSERAVDKVLTEFRSGGNLASPTARQSTNTAYNYSARMLSVNPQGIPKVLGTSGFTDPDTSIVVGVVGNDIPLGTYGSVRYVVDRLCATTGDETSLGAGVCRLADNPVPVGTSLSNLQGADRAPLCPTCASAAPQGVVYRLSIKVTGPRNTQSFFQSTFTVPSSS
jgi:type IV pilus assembly protein PilX